MTIEEILEQLKTETTILLILGSNDELMEDPKYDMGLDLYWNNNYSDVLCDDNFEGRWEKKFKSFGTVVNDERKRYRVLYDSMVSFFVSFKELLSYKNSPHHIDERYYILRAKSHLMQMYMAGKKSYDVLRKIDKNYEFDYGKKFAQTRNLLFEHNLNPRKPYKNFIFHSELIDIINTSSIISVEIYTDAGDHYTGYVDFYLDYLKVAEEYATIVKWF